ncbi:MAG: hypothetical protein JKX97_03755, partial [Candidatus Lindowbacteria bacterium]|nr:hypothetical protein [Candidatus Lindowbacteria bacterium]
MKFRIALFVIFLSFGLVGTVSALSQGPPKQLPNHRKERGTPNNDDVYVRLSEDGVKMSAPVGPIVKQGSSPDGVKLFASLGEFDTGTELLYFVDFSNWGGRPHSERIAMIAIGPDTKEQRVKRIKFDDSKMEKRAVDPSVVILPDGRVRMYFMTPGLSRYAKNIRSAVSKDGINFTMEKGVRIEAPGNPEVHKTSGGWLMLLSDERNHTSRVAISKDGLKWFIYGGIELPGAMAGVIAHDDRTIRVYANDGGIISYLLDVNTFKIKGNKKTVVQGKKG